MKRASILALLLLCACVSCERSSAPTSSGTGPGAGALSDAEIRYGMAPTHGPNIVYQDDVIVFDHGPDAVHSVSSNGLTWTIDANAPHADELQPGKVMFLTSRAVGRVLGVQRSGGELAVTIGPVEITDVIKEAHVSVTQPIDLNSMTAYSAPDYPNSTGGGSSQIPMQTARLTPQTSSVIDAFDALVAQPALAGPPPLAGVGDFRFTPFCCGGIGLKMEYNRGGLMVKGLMVVYLDAPSLRFVLDISGGKVHTAELQLQGVAGVKIAFDAGTSSGLSGNVSTKPIWIPVDLSLPVVGSPPFAVTLQQQFLIKTGFGARNSTLSAGGDYAFTGSFHMGYHEGSWDVGAPLTFTVRRSLLDSISGVSLGAVGLVMGYQARIIVGIGAFGFVTGPYFGYGMGVGIVNGAGTVALLGAPCRAATFDVDLHVGIGYSMPAPVTGAINFILRKLNLREIEGSGGLDHREKLIDKHDEVPKGSSCGGGNPAS